MTQVASLDVRMPPAYGQSAELHAFQSEVMELVAGKGHGQLPYTFRAHALGFRVRTSSTTRVSASCESGPRLTA